MLESQPEIFMNDDQKLGTIYRCKNNITGLSYIGQTRKELSKRVQGHYNDTINTKTKFGNALKKYDRKDWQWETIAEVPYNLLDITEKKYIAEFNSYRNGYNSNTGQDLRVVSEFRDKIYKNKTVFNFYSSQHGVISCTMKDLTETYNLCHAGVSQIVNRSRPRYKDWVLAEFKDQYDEILGLYEFWHPVHGYLKCSSAELEKNYNVSHASITHITSGSYTRAKNWYLFQNKHKFKKLYSEW